MSYVVSRAQKVPRTSTDFNLQCYHIHGDQMKICDQICGSGKTSAAIKMMRDTPNNHYLFITPFLDEVDRICSACGFEQPDGNGKQYSLHKLLADRRNIASTHALFLRANLETIDLIRSGHYVLVLDEVADVVQVFPCQKQDIQDMINLGYVSIAQDNRLVWCYPDYDKNGAYNVYRSYIENGHAMWFGDDRLFLWFLSEDLFKAFDECYVLTYMFHAQIQRVYFDLFDISYEYIGTKRLNDGSFEFCDKSSGMQIEGLYAPHIHILENDKMNAIGERTTALCKTWFRRNSNDQLRRNIYNVYRNIWGCKSDEFLWTTFKDYQDDISGKGFKSAFLQSRSRATNKYAGCKYLAYGLNVYVPVGIKQFLNQKNVHIDDDDYALSELLQWLFRSAVRNQQDVFLYLPSRRMRNLLQEWIDKYGT